jgi:predicted Zn-dependent protease
MSDGFTVIEHDRAFAYRKSAGKNTGPVVITRPRSRPQNDPSTQYDSCLAAFRAGEWDAAESRLNALVAACPTFVPGILLLGGLYAHRGRFDDAMTQAERALTVSALEPRAHLLVGMIASRRERHDDALQSLRRALYLDDSLALGHFWLGNLYRDRGDVARARQEYENVVRDWERHTLQLTEEFASDLTAEQLVGFCSDTLKQLTVHR